MSRIGSSMELTGRQGLVEKEGASGKMPRGSELEMALEVTRFLGIPLLKGRAAKMGGLQRKVGYGSNQLKVRMVVMESQITSHRNNSMMLTTTIKPPIGHTIKMPFKRYNRKCHQIRIWKCKWLKTIIRTSRRTMIQLSWREVKMGRLIGITALEARQVNLFRSKSQVPRRRKEMVASEHWLKESRRSRLRGGFLDIQELEQEVAVREAISAREVRRPETTLTLRSRADHPVVISKLRCPWSTKQSNRNSKSKTLRLMISTMQKANTILISLNNSKWSPYRPIKSTSNLSNIYPQRTTSPLPMPPRLSRSKPPQAKYWRPLPTAKHLRIKTRFFPN